MSQILIRPLVTEKMTAITEKQGKFGFIVHVNANKIEIKQAVEALFKVKVDDVRTVNMAGKVKRVGRNIGKRSNWKKAYVTLQKGQSLDFFEV